VDWEGVWYGVTVCQLVNPHTPQKKNPPNNPPFSIWGGKLPTEIRGILGGGGGGGGGAWAAAGYLVY